ncbi:MAG: toprim domain-containing protein, partial [Limisphaerales bacterium]
DEQGRVVGFSGRILSGDEKVAKYVNSPETPIFTKSKIFFGLDKSKRAILDAGFAIICEGQLDLISCFMAGIQNVIAPQGTAFTDQHARILKRYVDEVVLCFDSDLAGQKASIRGLEGLLTSQFARKASVAFEPGAPVRDTLLSSGLAIRVAILPSPHDPDSFIKKFGGDAFQKLIKEAKGFFDFYLNHLCEINDIKSDGGKTAVVKAMAETLHKTSNMVLSDTYAQKTAARLEVSAESVRAEFKKVLSAKVPIAENESETLENAGQSETSRPSPSEFHLLKLLLIHDELIPKAALHLDLNWIQNPLAHEIVARRFSALKNETWKTLAAFLDECNSGEMRNLVTEAVAEERRIPNPEMQLADVILKLRNQFLDRQIGTLTQKASQPEISEMEKVELLREQQQLRQLKRQPLAVESNIQHLINQQSADTHSN